MLLIFLIFFLSSRDDGDTTTTIVALETTSTTIGGEETTTTGAQVTTSTDGGTTTTTGESTTTTAQETTTTQSVSGDWADEPLVVAGFGALGWWDGSSWVQVSGGDALPVVGGEDYQVAVLDLSAITSGSGQEILCEPVNNTGVILTDEELLGDWPGPYGVAISAPWDLVPHVVEELEDDGTYEGFAADLLADRGLVVGEPELKQLLRVDLEGDGVNEVIVVAEDVAEGLIPVEGDYSIIFMRKVVEGDVQTLVLGEAIVLDPGTQFSASFAVGAVADMSGDGKMEIIMSTGFFEGISVEVIEYVNDDLGTVSQIQTGCGA